MTSLRKICFAGAAALATMTMSASAAVTYVNGGTNSATTPGTAGVGYAVGYGAFLPAGAITDDAAKSLSIRRLRRV